MPAGTKFFGGCHPRRPGKAAGVGHAHAAPYPDSWTILRKAVQRPSRVFRLAGRVRNPSRVLTSQTLCFAAQSWNDPLLGISAIPDGPDAKLLPGPKSTYRDQHIPRLVCVCAHPHANSEGPGSLRIRTGLGWCTQLAAVAAPNAGALVQKKVDTQSFCRTKGPGADVKKSE